MAADPELIATADRAVANVARAYGMARVNSILMAYFAQHHALWWSTLRDRRLPALVAKAITHHPESVIRALHDEFASPTVSTEGT